MLPTRFIDNLKTLLLLPSGDNANLLQWRISILRMLMLATIFLGLLTIIPQALFPHPNRSLILVMDFVTLALLAGLCFYPSISYTTRARLFLLLVFGFWCWLFTQIGVSSLIYLLAVPLFASLLLDLVSAMLAVLVSILALFWFGMWQYPDYQLGNAPELAGLFSWLMLTLNFAFVSVLLTATCGLLINRMSAALRLSRESRIMQRRNEKLQAVGTLASGVAHDFNNILMIIVALSETLRDQRTDAETREAVDKILLSADRGRDIVRKLLTFSRQTTPARSPLEMNAEIQEMMPLLQAQVPPGIRLQASYTDPAWVTASVAEIQQILMNLVGNAVLAIKPRESGEIDIRLTRLPPQDSTLAQLPEFDARAGALKLVVRDNGVGINADDMARLFEPFFTTRQPGKGTGLGLASCHGITIDMGGMIQVESREGEFTEFSIFLPLVKAPEPVAATPVASADPVHGQKPLEGVTVNGADVLLVDDEELILQTTRRILESAGYRVTPASGATQARQALASRSFDLLITDYSMPDDNGVNLARHARTIYPGLPILLITGLGQLNGSTTSDVPGMQVLGKPYKRAVLLQLIRELLTQPGPV